MGFLNVKTKDFNIFFKSTTYITISEIPYYCVRKFTKNKMYLKNKR